MYAAELGRFLSRDPVPGVRAYEYAGGAPSCATDALGLWVVKRQGGGTAPATTESGDTIQVLADSIGLNAGEWRSWLTFEGDSVTTSDGKTLCYHHDLKVTTPLCAGQEFEIPNSVYMMYAGDYPSLGKLYVEWGNDALYLESLGFRAWNIRGDRSSVTPGQVTMMTNGLSNSKQLHGLFVNGHGNIESFGSSGPEWTVRYSDIEDGLQYKLALVIVNACGSQNGVRTLCASAPQSVCRGHSGIHDPSNGWGNWAFGWPTGTPYIHIWDALSPGDQLTKHFAWPIPH